MPRLRLSRRPRKNGGVHALTDNLETRLREAFERGHIEGVREPTPAQVAEVRYEIAPITGKAACKWIAETHRHLDAPQGALFAVAVNYNRRMVGAATAGNPPRVWQGSGRFVITRCAVLPGLDPVGNHAAPACTMLYGALCRAGKALGYTEAWTYTLPGENGASLRAAGFTYMGETAGGEWDRPSRSRRAAVRAEKKGRRMRRLAVRALLEEGREG